MDDRPLVSIITPTHNRERFLPLTYRCFQSQSWPSLEWLVGDSSPVPSPFMSALHDERITYVHDTVSTTLGEKRNALVARASGAYIVHFDDDDYYSPQYIEQMVAAAIQSGADLTKLSAFFLFNRLHNAYAYWDLMVKEGVHLAWTRDSLRARTLTTQDWTSLTDNHLGFGFSYVYKRSVWDRERFSAMNWGEDIEFARRIDLKCPVRLFPDITGLCIHLLHDTNSSSCFPQFVIPEFLALRLLPAAGDHLALFGEV
jgi:glycosyltransferase involved in cell wall biosynthesis